MCGPSDATSAALQGPHLVILERRDTRSSNSSSRYSSRDAAFSFQPPSDFGFSQSWGFRCALGAPQRHSPSINTINPTASSYASSCGPKPRSMPLSVSDIYPTDTKMKASGPKPTSLSLSDAYFYPTTSRAASHVSQTGTEMSKEMAAASCTIQEMSGAPILLQQTYARSPSSMLACAPPSMVRGSHRRTCFLEQQTSAAPGIQNPPNSMCGSSKLSIRANLQSRTPLQQQRQHRHHQKEQTHWSQQRVCPVGSDCWSFPAYCSPTPVNLGRPFPGVRGRGFPFAAAAAAVSGESASPAAAVPCPGGSRMHRHSAVAAAAAEASAADSPAAESHSYWGPAHLPRCQSLSESVSGAKHEAPNSLMRHRRGSQLRPASLEPHNVGYVCSANGAAATARSRSSSSCSSAAGLRKRSCCTGFLRAAPKQQQITKAQPRQASEQKTMKAQSRQTAEQQIQQRVTQQQGVKGQPRAPQLQRSRKQDHFAVTAELTKVREQSVGYTRKPIQQQQQQHCMPHCVQQQERPHQKQQQYATRVVKGAAYGRAAELLQAATASLATAATDSTQAPTAASAPSTTGAVPPAAIVTAAAAQIAPHSSSGKTTAGGWGKRPDGGLHARIALKQQAAQHLQQQQHEQQHSEQHQKQASLCRVVGRTCRVIERSAYRRPWRLLLQHAAQQRVLQLLQRSECSDLGDSMAEDLQRLSTTEEKSSRDICQRLEKYRKRLHQQQQRRKQRQQHDKQQQHQLIQQLATAAQELKKANDQQKLLQGRLACALTRLQRLEQENQGPLESFAWQRKQQLHAVNCKP